MDKITAIGSIILAIMGCGNILQFIFYRAYKNKAYAEADTVQIENEKKRLNLKHAATKGLQEQCDSMLAGMIKIQVELQQKMIEVAELRAKIVTKDYEIKTLVEEREYYKNLYEQAMARLDIYENI